MTKFKLGLIGTLTAVASVAGGLVARSLVPTTATTPNAPRSTPSISEPAMTVPAFKFTDRNGLPITPNDLVGNVWIASFVFTRCSGTCPAVTATVARLQKELTNVPNLKLVTFTIDPDRDTTDELKKYAERYQADPNRWLFLTGPEDEIHALANQNFKMLVKKNNAPKPGEEFDHGTRLIVIGKQGDIRGLFDGMPSRTGGEEAFEENLTRLKTLVRDLASR
jgi:protein SCO1